jgi:hypothetical protein
MLPSIPGCTAIHTEDQVTRHLRLASVVALSLLGARFVGAQAHTTAAPHGAKPTPAQLSAQVKNLSGTIGALRRRLMMTSVPTRPTGSMHASLNCQDGGTVSIVISYQKTATAIDTTEESTERLQASKCKDAQGSQDGVIVFHSKVVTTVSAHTTMSLSVNGQITVSPPGGSSSTVVAYNNLVIDWSGISSGRGAGEGVWSTSGTCTADGVVMHFDNSSMAAFAGAYGY